MKKYTLLAALAFSALTVTATPKENTSQGNPQEMDKFITELMGKMTLHEKIGQLNLPVTGNIVTGQAKSSDVAGKIRNGEVGGLFNLKGVKNIREVQKLAVENSRLGIPLLFGMDVIHGYETVFPIPLALSCSWDMEAIEKSARIAAIESSADGICWTFSPMVDICRDARWGRVSEGNGEDPFLGSAIAQAMIRGYQGKDMSANNEIMACVKHFALYGAGEAGRDYNTVDMSRNRMFNEYFPPYKAAVEAGVGSAMTSFNEIDGVPATANHWLLTDVLRNQWGFDGFVVTDYTAISEMIDHGIGDLQEVSARALTAGTDMDMVADGFIGTLEKSLKEGKVTEADIDKACRRILEAKYKLGLFANPYKYCDVKRAEKEVFTPEHRSIARQIAVRIQLLGAERDVTVLEGGVAQAIAERIQRVVAHIQVVAAELLEPFAFFQRTAGILVVVCHRQLAHILRESGGQLTAGANVSEHYVGNGVCSFTTSEPYIQDGRNIFILPSQHYGTSGEQYQYYGFARFQQRAGKGAGRED
jgi:beta-glucosidase